jgi:O-antigen/teichoic acid export membrane protein
VTPVSHPGPATSPSTSGAVTLARGTFVVAAALGLAQVLAYLVSIVAARVLGPAQFGVLAALLGLLLIGNVVALGMQAVIARHIVTVAVPLRGEVAGYALRRSLAVAIAVGIAALVLAPGLHWVLQLDTWWPLLWVALTLVPLTWIGAQLGVAQGQEAFGRLAVVYASVGIGRGLGGVAGAVLGQTATSTIIGILLGTIVGALAGRVAVSALTANGRARIDNLVGQVAHATHALLALFLLTNIDVILARALLDADDAGVYGVGAVIAKVAFWLPQFVGVMAFPRLADARRSRALLVTITAVGGLGVVVIVATAMLPQLAVAVAGGPQYTALVPLAWLFALIGAMFALAQALLMSRLALDDRLAVIAVWAAIALLCALAIWVMPRSVAGLATATSIAGAAVVIVGLIHAVIHERHSFANHRDL